METLKSKTEVDKKLYKNIERLSLNEKRQLARELDALLLYKKADFLKKGVRKNKISMDEIVRIVRKVRRGMYLENARQNNH